jgi:hypothetical protein
MQHTFTHTARPPWSPSDSQYANQRYFNAFGGTAGINADGECSHDNAVDVYGFNDRDHASVSITTKGTGCKSTTSIKMAPAGLLELARCLIDAAAFLIAQRDQQDKALDVGLDLDLDHAVLDMVSAPAPLGVN